MTFKTSGEATLVYSGERFVKVKIHKTVKTEKSRWRALMKVRAHVFIAGRVQGVFFRSETQREATKHGVTGWVRNLPDGKVEAVFEGEEQSVKKMIEFCKRGPPGAKVTDVDVVWENYEGEFRNFEIRYGYRF